MSYAKILESMNVLRGVVEESFKTCCLCSRTLDTSEFYHRKDGGFGPYCKRCSVEKAAKRNKKQS